MSKPAKTEAELIAMARAEMKVHADCPDGIVISVLRDGDSGNSAPRPMTPRLQNPAIPNASRCWFRSATTSASNMTSRGEGTIVAAGFGGAATHSDRKNSSRVQDVLRIERALERAHGFDFLLGPAHLQVRPLQDADAVFGRDRAAESPVRW